MTDRENTVHTIIHPFFAWHATLVALICLLWPTAFAFSQEFITTAEQASLANERLAAYRSEQPDPSQRRLRFAYFVPSDRQPAAQYRERLTRVLDAMTQFYAEQIASYGLDAQPIPLDRDEDGLLRFTMVQGKQPWQAYNTKEPASGAKIYSECLPALRAAGIEPTQETIAVFTAVMDWDSERMRFRQRSPYQGGGNARSGFCWQIDAPPLDPNHLSEKSPLIDDGEYGRVSIGKWNSIFIGGVIHELGHAFGLAHNAQPPTQQGRAGISLMGSGNRVYGDQLRNEGAGTYLTFADALRLVSHPLFSGSDKGLQTAARYDDMFADLQVETEGDSMIISGTVRCSPSCYAVICYTDPTGHGDYDALTSTAVPDDRGRFRMRCDNLAQGTESELRLTAVKLNGDAFTHTGMKFSVSNEGEVNTESIRERLILAPVLAKLRMGAAREAAILTAAIPDEEPAKAIAAPMLRPPSQRPLIPDEDARSWSLCDLRPAAATVGWRTPAFDYSPEDLWIEVTGTVQRRGIYAHANSTYKWNLDGDWKSLTATCAVSDGPPGSVVFVVRVNGQETWRSPVTRPGQLVPCKLNIADAKTLELIVEDAGDGNRRDHGYWLDPVITK